YRPVCPHAAGIASAYGFSITGLSRQGLKALPVKLSSPACGAFRSDSRNTLGMEHALHGRARLNKVQMSVELRETGLVQQARLARPAGENHQITVRHRMIFAHD